MSNERERIDVATEVDDIFEQEEDFDASVLPSCSHTLDKRLNPEAPDFVPSITNHLLTSKILDDLVGYTRWSNTGTENVSYGARYESIWSEKCIQLQAHAQALAQAQVQAQAVVQEPHPKLSPNLHSKSVQKPHEQPQTQLANIIGSEAGRGPQQQPQQLAPPVSKKRPVAPCQQEGDPGSESGPSGRCCACTIM